MMKIKLKFLFHPQVFFSFFYEKCVIGLMISTRILCASFRCVIIWRRHVVKYNYFKSRKFLKKRVELRIIFFIIRLTLHCFKISLCMPSKIHYQVSVILAYHSVYRCSKSQTNFNSRFINWTHRDISFCKPNGFKFAYQEMILQ